MAQRGLLVASLLTVSMGIGGTLRSTSFAQKASVPKHPDPVAIASERCKEILILLDPDKNGKISRQEWMKFMEQEFDRLDTNKKGEIDPKDVMQSMISVRRVRAADLGK